MWSPTPILLHIQDPYCHLAQWKYVHRSRRGSLCVFWLVFKHSRWPQFFCRSAVDKIYECSVPVWTFYKIQPNFIKRFWPKICLICPNKGGRTDRQLLYTSCMGPLSPTPFLFCHASYHASHHASHHVTNHTSRVTCNWCVMSHIMSRIMTASCHLNCST